MTEQRRAALTSVTTNKKDKSSKKISKTYRFVITLPEPTEQICPEFNFSELVKNAEKKQKDKKADSKVQVNGLDPLEEDDQENLKAIARHYEEKYGGVKKRHGRFEDYCDLGAGYDETDPFIDNTDAYDEIVPDEMTTAHGGFYINSGALKFKEIPTTNDSDRDEVRERKRPKIKRTMTIAEDGARVLKKPKLDQHKKMVWIKKHALIKEQEMQKRRRRKQQAADDMARKKSATVKELLKERRGDLTSRGYPPEEPAPAPVAVTSSNPVPVQETVKTTMNSSIADAIESVVKASQISDDSSGEPDKPLSAPGSVKPVRSDVEECYDMENKEHGTREESEVKLPENLSDDLLKMVDVLKQVATSSSAGKSKFFSPDVNRTLLSIEMKVHNLSAGDRQSVYGHLASYLPCTRDTLMRRAKKLVSQQSDEMVKQPLRRLKILIDEMMPSVISSYTQDYERAVREKSLQEAAVAEGKTENVKTIRIPRKRFPWTTETRSLLCEIVKIKLQYFELVKTRKENVTDMLTTYLETRIKVLWPTGWIKTNNLLQESRSAHIRSGPLQETSNIPGADATIKDIKLQRKKFSWVDDVDERKKARKNASVTSSFLSNVAPCEPLPSSSPVNVQTTASLTNPPTKSSKSVPMDLTMSAASASSTPPSSKPVSVISQISDSVSITLTNVKSKNFPSEAALPSSLTVTPTTRIAATGPGISKPPVFGKSKIGDVVITKTNVSPEKPRENVTSNSISTQRTISDTPSSIYSNSAVGGNSPVLSSSAAVSKSKGIFDINNTNWTVPSPPVSKSVSSTLAHMNIPDCISVMPSYLNTSSTVPLTHSKPVTSISAVSVPKPTAAPTVLKSTPSVPKSSTPSVLSSSVSPISKLPIMKPTHSVISKSDTPLPSELTITAPSVSVSITSKPSPPIPKPGTPPSVPKSNTPPFISKPNTPPSVPKPSTPPTVIKPTSTASVLSNPTLSITGSFTSGSVVKPAQSLSPSLSVSKPPPPLPSPPKPIMNLKQRILQGSSMIPSEPVVVSKKKENEAAEDGIDIIEILDEDTDIENSSKYELDSHHSQKNSGGLKQKADSLTKKDYDMLGIADPKPYFASSKKRDTEKHTSEENVCNKRVSSDLREELALVSDTETKKVKVGSFASTDHNHTSAFDQHRRTIGALDAVSQIISESLSARPLSTSHHKEEKRHNKVLSSLPSEYHDPHQHSRPSFEPSKGVEEPENLKKKSDSASPIDPETSVQIEMDRVMKELMQLQGHMSNEITKEDTSSPTSVIACSSASSSSLLSKNRDKLIKMKDDHLNAKLSAKGFQDEFQKHLLQIKDSGSSVTDKTERQSEFAEQSVAPLPMSSDQAAAYEDFSQSAVNSSHFSTPDLSYNLPPSDMDTFTGFHFMGPLLSHFADLKTPAHTSQTSSSHHSTTHY